MNFGWTVWSSGDVDLSCLSSELALSPTLSREPPAPLSRLSRDPASSVQGPCSGWTDLAWLTWRSQAGAGGPGIVGGGGVAQRRGGSQHVPGQDEPLLQSLVGHLGTRGPRETPAQVALLRCHGPHDPAREAVFPARAGACPGLTVVILMLTGANGLLVLGGSGRC